MTPPMALLLGRKLGATGTQQEERDSHLIPQLSADAERQKDARLCRTGTDLRPTARKVPVFKQDRSKLFLSNDETK